MLSVQILFLAIIIKSAYLWRSAPRASAVVGESGKYDTNDACHLLVVVKKRENV